MDYVKIKGKKFKKYIDRTKIEESIRSVAKRINDDMNGQNPLMLCVLNGSFMFASDLIKELTIDCEISFVKVASYDGTTSTDTVKTLIGLNEDIRNREIIIVEDIVDTGNTIVDIIDQIKQFDPADVRIATMLYKPDAYTKDIYIDYIALTVPNDFLVGYGLDYDGLGRNYTSIYSAVEEEAPHEVS